MNHKRMIWNMAAVAMTLGILQASANEVPLNLPKPDSQPGDAKKPVKVYILAGQSNMVGMGNISGAQCPYTGIYLTADPGASFGTLSIYLGGNSANSYKIAPLGIYASADPGAAKGAKASIYQGAPDPKVDYTKLTPVRTATVALGTVAEKLPAVDGPHTVVVDAFIEVPAGGNYTVHAGFEDSTHNVVTLDGKEVYRKDPGGQPVITKVALETGKRYPVKITWFKGGSAAFWLSQEDLEGKGDLETVTKKDRKFTYLLDEAGKWSVRNDVFYRQGRENPTLNSSPLSAMSNGGTIGPELGFGHVMGTFHDEAVLLIKTALGNRSLNWDFRPPSSGKTDREGASQWEGLEYRFMVDGVRKSLEQIDKIVPGYAGQGYEIAGFGWFQGHKDKDSTKAEYEKHLVNLISDLRKEFKAPKMPVVVATVGFNGYRIEEGPWKGVWEAQLAVGDPKQHPELAATVAAVDTRDFWREVDESPRGEDYHYNRNAETYLLVGEAMGRAMVGLQGGNAAPIPLAGRKQVAAPAAAPELDEAAKAAAAKAAQKALKPVILDGMLRAYVADPRNHAAVLAAVKGEEPANASQFLRDTVDAINYFHAAAGVQDYEWHAFGPDMNNAEWECFSFDPPETLDKTKGAARYRKVTYPAGMENWFAPDFDAAKAGWKKGLPPFGNKEGKLEPLGACTNNPCLCGVIPRTLWEKEVMLIRGTFDIPAFKDGHRYRFVVGGSNHVMAGEGYAIYVNGKLAAESKTGVPNRAGGQPRGGHVYADLRGEFKGGKVTVAATSFLQFNRRGSEGRPMGHLTLWLEEQKLPPLE